MRNNDLETTISNLIGAMAQQSESMATESDLYLKLIQNPEILKNARRLHYEYFFRNSASLRAALVKINYISKDKCGELVDIYCNYMSYKSQLEFICSKFEGVSCCADKSKAILEHYLFYIKNGSLKEWDAKSPECFWLPEFGTQQQWMDLITGFYHMQYGNPEKYLLAYRDLMQAGQDLIVLKNKEQDS